MNVNYTLEESTNSSITFIDLHKFLNYIIFQKENNFLDKKTKQYVNDVTEKYNLEHFVNLDLSTLKTQKYQIVNDFQNKHKIINDKITKLKLIKNILKIDLDYYNNQVSDIKNILNNTDFKNDMVDINDKMSNNEDLNEDNFNKLLFHRELLKQQAYIKNIVLSSENIIITNRQDIIKNKIVEQMKLIEDETKIYLRESNLNSKINYNEVMDLWNEETLNKLMKKIKMTHSDESNNMNLKYQLIENLRKLTNKSHSEIQLVIKDKKFKEKIFGNINIKDITGKLKQLTEEIKQYNKIDHFLDEIQKDIHVCPFCNFQSNLPIDTLLHLSLHKNKENFQPIRLNTYNDSNKNLKSKHSEHIITSITDTFYSIKKQIFKSDEIVNYTLQSAKVPKFDDVITGKYIKKELYVVDIKEKVLEFKNSLMIYYKTSFATYPQLKEDILKIIDTNIEKLLEKVLFDELFEEEAERVKFAKVSKIINYHITRKILNQYFTDEDVSNLYNSNIQFFDKKLKNNKAIDTLFKKIIHYNTYEPVEKMKQVIISFLKIINNTNDLNSMLFADITSSEYKRINKDNKTVVQKTVPLVEVTEYLDYNTLLLLIPILKNRNFTLQIRELISSEEFELNEDEDSLFKPWEWVQSSEYNKMIRLLSNITKQDINLKLLENDEHDDLKRIHQLFLNISIKDLKQINKEFDLVTDIFEGFLRKSRVVHDINTIDNNKDINGKFKEYVIGSYLRSILDLLNKIVELNIDNTTNTKSEIFNVFSTLSIYLNKESSYLVKNKNVFQKKRRDIVVNKNNKVEKNNKDEILNEYFESDGEEEYEDLEENFDEEIDDDMISNDEIQYDDEEDLEGDLEREGNMMFGNEEDY
jgi:hypothetical protein